MIKEQFPVIQFNDFSPASGAPCHMVLLVEIYSNINVGISSS